VDAGGRGHGKDKWKNTQKMACWTALNWQGQKNTKGSNGGRRAILKITKPTQTGKGKYLARRNNGAWWGSIPQEGERGENHHGGGEPI